MRLEQQKNEKGGKTPNLFKKNKMGAIPKGNPNSQTKNVLIPQKNKLSFLNWINDDYPESKTEKKNVQSEIIPQNVQKLKKFLRRRSKNSNQVYCV